MQKNNKERELKSQEIQEFRQKLKDNQYIKDAIDKLADKLGYLIALRGKPHNTNKHNKT